MTDFATDTDNINPNLTNIDLKKGLAKCGGDGITPTTANLNTLIKKLFDADVDYVAGDNITFTENSDGSITINSNPIAVTDITPNSDGTVTVTKSDGSSEQVDIDTDQVTSITVEGNNFIISNEDGSKVTMSRTEFINFLNIQAGVKDIKVTGNATVTKNNGVYTVKVDEHYTKIAEGAILSSEFEDMPANNNKTNPKGYKTPGADPNNAQNQQWWINTGIKERGRSQTVGKYIAVVSQEGTITGPFGIGWWEDVEIVVLTWWTGPQNVYIRVTPRLGPGTKRYGFDRYTWKLYRIKGSI